MAMKQFHWAGLALWVLLMLTSVHLWVISA